MFLTDITSLARIMMEVKQLDVQPTVLWLEAPEIYRKLPKLLIYLPV